jgi:hypothetical protein
MFLRGDEAYKALNQVVKNYRQASTYRLDDILRIVKEMNHMESLKRKHNPHGDPSIEVLSIKDMKKWNFYVEFLLQLNIIQNNDEYGTMRMCSAEGGLHLDLGHTTVVVGKHETPSDDDADTTQSDDDADLTPSNDDADKNPSNDDADQTPSSTTKYASTPCCCGEDECEGAECQYNQLCGECERVLGKHVGIFCVTTIIHGETVLCDDCYDEDMETTSMLTHLHNGGEARYDGETWTYIDPIIEIVQDYASTDNCSDKNRCESCVHCARTKVCDMCHCVGGCYEDCVYLQD